MRVRHFPMPGLVVEEWRTETEREALNFEDWKIVM